MPRRRFANGQVERANRRNRHLNNIQGNEGNSISQITHLGLEENYKSAMSTIPQNYSPHSLGPMSLICCVCNSKHFKAEVTSGQNNLFSLCCHKGKAVVESLSPNTFFENLCRGMTSSDRSIKQRSKNYFNNIRSFNSAFAMISSEAKISDTSLNGVYHFKIHDVFYHRAGALRSVDDRPPCYAQLYFYDVETANQFRMRVRANTACDGNLMRSVSEELHRGNPFVRSFMTMSEYCQHSRNNVVEISMVINANQNLDLRRYNDVVQTDVAVIFKSTDGEPPFERNMVVFSKNLNMVRKVSVLDPSLDPLAYPLLFPNGDTGWHLNMTHSRTSRSAIPRNKVTMLQYASFRLAIRDDLSILHSSKKLFLQWIVDMYVRIEGTRLNFIRNNQASLRADVYHNLTDFIQNPREDGERIGRRIVLPSTFIGSPRNMHQNYLDAMAIVQHFGKPSLFITMTCNPRWPEISENLTRHISVQMLLCVFFDANLKN